MPFPTTTKFERHLLDEIDALRAEVDQIRVRPIPDSTDLGYQVWSALMEDLRSEGVMRLEVRLVETVEITWTEV